MKRQTYFLGLFVLFFLFLTGNVNAQESNLDVDLANYILMCESGGKESAINWEDAKGRKDKQPSRGPWQFYWGTWLKYAKIYKVIPEDAKLTLKQVNDYMHDIVYSSAVAHGMIAEGIAEDHWKRCTNLYWHFANL